jgi:hypothetical protein
MFKHAFRLAAVAAVVPVALALSALPGSAQVVSGTVTVTGTATCNAATGHPTWTVHWTIDNTIAVEIPARAPAAATPEDVTVDSAVESGLVSTDLTDGVSPNPIPGNSAATATDGPVPNAVGDITLTVEYHALDTKDTVEGTVHLDGTCVLVEPTTSTTAPPAAQAAVQAEPAFTG